MDITKIIDPLNDAQRDAVTADPKAMLVLAGAGSGKTRVLVHRIAWHILVNGHPAHSILAVTFTNKAAKEMRARVEELLRQSTQPMWIGTFHGLAHRLLRRHAELVKLIPTFQVMDSSDQLRLIKQILKSMNLDDTKFVPREVQWFINAQKEEGLRAKHLPESRDPYQQQMQLIYRMYEAHCERSSLVDFAELQLRAHELLRDNPDILAFYQNRFSHIHVDEFQDTNSIQYAWLRLLTGDNNNLFVVGDDDQSIYGWRGAKIENIFNFQKHFPDHGVIKLEQNYRSTGNILNAANRVIAQNQGRMGKELWTDAGEGELISVYEALNEWDEAEFVVGRIRAWALEGGERKDCAILYRSNAQSRQFEEKLMTTGTPYRVYGGLRFFDRAEIKNALAYLRLMANRHDDASFERIVNTPTRGIGTKALDDIRVVARDHSISLWDAAVMLINQNKLTARAANALKGFLDLIKNLGLMNEGLTLAGQVKLAIEHSGLMALYEKEKADKGEEKVENLQELVNAAELFYFDQDNEEQLSELDMFLTHASLEAGEMQGDEFDDCVQLMTLHSAKGLEFKQVFMVGMEESLFPSQQSVDDVQRMEEERRLCYVGMTRAMQRLYLTHSAYRSLYGRKSEPRRPSRFLREIPAEFVQEVRMRATVSRPEPAFKPKAQESFIQAAASLKLGQDVRHAKFGPGVVLKIEGSGAHERAQINFKQDGVKWLMLAYANLEAL